MKTYLVGGAVRDRLLGLPVRERDWVVVGETPDTLEALGFKRVGKDFPVFLHPRTHEEYALARTERKVAPGHRGFEVHASPTVTLEEDLRRRDLTINAMAMDEEGHLIDPYGGREDLERRLLRHVSPAFAEDPLRILRVARFAARYAHLGFRVAEETRRLMRQMVDAGEIDALTPERVWQELIKALGERTPVEFFRVLRDCGANPRLFPEIEGLFGVPQPQRWHPEIDTGVHTMMVLSQAARLSDDTAVRFAALTHDLGKALTPPEMWPGHRGHESRGLEPLRQLCQRLKAPRIYHRLAEKVMLYHGHCHRVLELRPTTIVEVLYALDVLHETRDFEPFLLACKADYLGRKGWEKKPYPQVGWWQRLRRAAMAVQAQALLARGLEGRKLGEELKRARVGAVAEEKRVLLKLAQGSGR